LQTARRGVPLPYLGRLVRAFRPRDRTAAGAVPGPPSR